MAIDKIQKDVLTSVANDMGLSYKEVEEIYLSTFKMIRSTVNELPIKQTELKKDILNLKTNFNIPRLGKMYLNINKVMRVKLRLKGIKSY